MLIVSALPALVISMLIQFTSKGGALYIQDRIGMNGRPFRIYKFRTMRITTAGNHGPGLTRDGDTRITPIGKYLRKLKLDEIPQLYNVLRGDMSLIGPRPKSHQYAEVSAMSYRPGITGAATIAFRREEELLGTFGDAAEMEMFYQNHVKPIKAQIDSQYMSSCTFWSDLRVLLDTIMVCAMPRYVPGFLRRDGVSPSEQDTQRMPIREYRSESRSQAAFECVAASEENL